MSFGQLPDAFMTFGLYFNDFDERPRGRVDRVAYLEKLLRNGLKALDSKQKRELADFLDQCLDGTHAEDELVHLWKRTRPYLVMQPVSPFFRDVRSRLRALGYQ